MRTRNGASVSHAMNIVSNSNAIATPTVAIDTPGTIAGAFGQRIVTRSVIACVSGHEETSTVARKPPDIVAAAPDVDTPGEAGSRDDRRPSLPDHFANLSEARAWAEARLLDSHPLSLAEIVAIQRIIEGVTVAPGEIERAVLPRTQACRIHSRIGDFPSRGRTIRTVTH